MVVDHHPRKGCQNRRKDFGHARYAVFQMAEVAARPDLFCRILDMIGSLRPPGSSARGKRKVKCARAVARRAGIALPGSVIAVETTIMLWRTRLPHQSAFLFDRNPAFGLPARSGGTA
jgi:hypothetical protein